MPFNAHPPGEFDQRLDPRLGKFDDLDTFGIKMVAALTRQFVDNPGFRFSLNQQPAAGEQRRRTIKADVERDTTSLFRVHPARPEAIGGDAGRLTYQTADVLNRGQRQ